MKRFLLAISVMLILGCSLVFAGGRRQPSVTGSDGKVKLKLWSPPIETTEAGMKAWEFRIQEFKKRYPNVELELEQQPPGIDYRQAYDTALMAGTVPTVVTIFPPVDVPTRAKNGTIKDISTLVENWDLRQQGLVNSAFDEALVIDGKWYGIISTLYVAATPYNRVALREGGGDPDRLPKTWDEFAALGQRITDKSKPRFAYIMMGMEFNAWPFTPWVWSAGGEMVRPNPDGTYRVAFTEEPGIDAAVFWHDMVWKYNMTQRNVLEGWDELQDDMASGRGIFGWGMINYFSDNALNRYNVPQETFGIMPIPARNSSNQPYSLCGGTVYAWSPRITDEQAKAGWDFAQLISFDKDFMEAQWAYENTLVGINADIPGRIDMTQIKFEKYGAAWPRHWAREFDELSRVTKLEPYCANWNELKNIIAPHLQAILAREAITREEIRAILNTAARECYDQYPNSFRPR
jgi:ABC-type glycerol-3-phosphate transport system substrate-binding protein